MLLDEIAICIGDYEKFRKLKNKLYKNNDKGFYAHAKTEIKSVLTVTKYVGRPAIAESRIITYYGTNITYKYIRHEDNKKVIEKVHVFEFIKK